MTSVLDIEEIAPMILGRFDEDESMDEADMAVELLGDLDDYEAVAF